ncbi:MAG: hypothetical protein AMXMBFR53_25390 [Gemmatimonadota bacterium]
MASVRLDAALFSPDTRAFVELLNAHAVRYVVVGGQAVVFHGHVRLTGDVDFFFSGERANASALFAALQDFWGGDVPGIASADELEPEGMVLQFGQPPNRIDLMNAIDGVAFEEAWAGRVEAALVGEGRETRLPFIGLDALVRNKRAGGRPKDLDDLSYLTGVA